MENQTASTPPARELVALTDEVTLGGRKTTILAEFKKQTGKTRTTHAFRTYSGDGHVPSPADRHFVTIWDDQSRPETFDISKQDFDYLRGNDG